MPEQDNAEASLEVSDIAVARALGGSVDPLTLLHAHAQGIGGEHRPEQDVMVEAVRSAIERGRNLLVQAGTGTGKSLAYLFPLACSGQRAVIATATNQLSEQLIRNDLPQVQQTLAETGQEFTFALLKGRNQYACLAKTNELASLDARAPGGQGEPPDQDMLFDMPEQEQAASTKRAQGKADAKSLSAVLEWASRTRSGDRTEGPVVPDRVWSQVSTSSSDCPGAGSCPFGDRCFTERARAAARQASVVVTNHALVAQDIRAAMNSDADAGPGATMFGSHAVLVVDEAHDLPDALTSALSTEVDTRAIGKFLSKAAHHVHDTEVDDKGEPVSIKRLRADLEALSDAFDQLPEGPLPTLPDSVTDLMAAAVTRMLGLHRMLADAEKSAIAAEKPKRAASISTLVSQAADLAGALSGARSVAEGRVRWISRDSRDNAPVLRSAPIEVGEAVEAATEGRTLIATSATLTLNNDFAPILRTLGLGPETTDTLDVGSPFDYPGQGMLYIPQRPFPEPVGKDRAEHTAAVLDDLTELVRAAGGRTLALFTTTANAQKAAEHLRRQFPGLTVHAHGDAPADSLVRQFSEEETSVLCATMGLWQGVNVEGASCSLVVIDKVAFAPIDDVLTAARRAHVDKQGRDGFTEVVVAQAATSLAQGAGRLIRTRADRGVVAILDPRLRSKGYGRLLIGSLPDFRLYADRDTVTSALKRLTGGLAPEAFQRRAGSDRPKPGGRKRAPARASATKSMGGKSLRPRRID